MTTINVLCSAVSSQGLQADVDAVCRRLDDEGGPNPCCEACCLCVYADIVIPPPAEAEAHYYAQINELAMVA